MANVHSTEFMVREVAAETLTRQVRHARTMALASLIAASALVVVGASFLAMIS